VSSGRYFSWLPFHDQEKKFLSVVFGRPIPVVQSADPSDEYIEEIWKLYAAQIRALYEEYKGKFGYDAAESLEFKEAKASSTKQREGGGGKKDKHAAAKEANGNGKKAQ
jgi:hypothetical protein